MKTNDASTKTLMTETGLSAQTLRTVIIVGCIAFPGLLTVLAANSGAPFWVYILFWFIGLVMYGTISKSMLPSQEERTAHALQNAPDAGRGTALIVGVKHDGIMETERIRMTRLRLAIAIEAESGTRHQAELTVKVEDALLPNFATGKTVHILYDRAHPDQVAIDRERTPLQVR